MNNPTEKLSKILEQERNKLRGSYPSEDVILPIIEIVRSIDYNHFMLSQEKTDAENRFLLEKYKTGWSLAFAEFYKDLTPTDNIPLFKFTPDEREWIDSIVQYAGKIEICQQSLNYCKADLFALEEHSQSFTFSLLNENAGIEYFEKISLAYYHSMIGGILEHKSKPLVEKLPQIRKKLENIVSVFQDDFIQYRATPEIDDFYTKLGYHYLMTTQIIDDFGEEDVFGGLKYGKYLDFAQYLFMAILMHKDCCMAAAIKTSHKVFLRNILTYAFSKSSFINSYSKYTEQPKSELEQILACFTLDSSNIEYHLSYPKASAPPYIMLGPDTMMRSAYGSIDSPVFFLNRELKRRFPKDYFNAVNNREKRFRDQLYSLFPEERIIKIEDNILIKSEKLVTDIDAVLFDKGKGTLGLFQLKWQDTFSTSTKERYSRITNLIPKSVEWIDKIDHWIANNDDRTISKTLKLGKDIEPIDDIYLFVISRNHVHFTNEKLDERAIWASWFQVLEALSEIRTSSTVNPIMELAIKLKLFSPELRMLREQLPVPEDLTFQLSEYEISIKSKL